MSAFRSGSNESCPAMKQRLFKTWAGAGIKNGVLLRLADGQFDALLTVDQDIEYQQNLSGLRISVVIMMAPATTSTTSTHCCQPLRGLLPVCGLGKSCEWVANLQMEPTRPNACAILSLRRAAHLNR